MLTIGVPKTARVLSGIKQLFKYGHLEAQYQNPSLIRFYNGVQAQAIILKPRRLAILTTRGRLDGAIMGQDVAVESGGDLRTLVCLRAESLGLRSTRVVLFADGGDSVTELDEVPQGSKVLSEYPRLTQTFFSQRPDINVIESPGGTEAEVPLLHRFGVAVVDSGESLKQHGLKEVATLLESSPVFVRSGYMPLHKNKRYEFEKLVDTFTRVIEHATR